MKRSDFFKRISLLLDEGRTFAVASLIEVKGSSPQSRGARMIIFPDGSTESTIGGGPFEAQVIKDCLELLKEGGETRVEDYNLTEDELGMFCQGKSRVLMETFAPDADLIIFGAGHVGSALAELAAATGTFSITVVDDRPEYADTARLPDADKVILTDRDYRENLPAVGPNSFLVIVTRCHPVDRQLVGRFAGSDAAYVGMIGSRSKRKKLFADLEEEGVSKKDLQKVHSPIGLPLGGKSPAEIAISILAELIKVKYEVFG